MTAPAAPRRSNPAMPTGCIVATSGDGRHGSWCPDRPPRPSRTPNRAPRTSPHASDGRRRYGICWGTLYELTKLDDDTFDQKLHDGTINPEMQHKDVARQISSVVSVSKISRRSHPQGRLLEQEIQLGATVPRGPCGQSRSQAPRHTPQIAIHCRQFVGDSSQPPSRCESQQKLILQELTATF
jgi:hypothetical protein